jgi:molecular chaperone HtpG
MLEQKWENTHFVRVDADVIERLIEKDDVSNNSLSETDSDKLTQVFMARIPKIEKRDFRVEISAIGEQSAPIILTQSEYMRRMKEMAQLQSGMSFYSDMPDMYSMVLNTDHPLVKNVLADVNVKVDEALKPIENELRGLNARRMAIEQSQKDMKAEDISQEEKDDLNNCREAILAEESKKAEVLKTYAETNALIPQLIDLALLQNGLLKGEALNNFIKRSIEICGK